MIAFPEELPLPTRRDYEFDPVSNIMATEMASGRSFQRQTFEVVPTYIELTWLFDDPQSQFFAYWAARMARADWFTMKLRTPLGYDDLVVRFTPDGIRGPKRFALNKWTYTAKVEIRENPLIAPGWVELLPGYVLLSDIFDRAVNQEWPEA
ncbi:hypothetical protein D3C76_520110 [compost metagenome]